MRIAIAALVMGVAIAAPVSAVSQQLDLSDCRKLSTAAAFTWCHIAKLEQEQRERPIKPSYHAMARELLDHKLALANMLDAQVLSRAEFDRYWEAAESRLRSYVGKPVTDEDATALGIAFRFEQLRIIGEVCGRTPGCFPLSK